MSTLGPLGVALLGTVMAIWNKKWAGQIMDNHRLLRGTVDPDVEARLLRLYRIIMIVSGCIFAVSGVLGALDVITVRH